MENFVFNNPTKIIFGKGAEAQIGEELKPYHKVLVHYGGGSIKRSGLYNRVIQSLDQAGVSWVELGGVKPNPVLSLVHQGIQLCRKEGVDMILAVGGGSAIDSAKAIAAGVCYEGEVWDFFEGKATVKEALPVSVILTIAAAGSESSDSAVITREEGLLKRSLNSDKIFPRFSILNPELTTTLPPYQSACGIADITAHIMERYFTRTPQVDFTDRLCEATLRTVTNFGPRVTTNPDDLEARAEILWAGTIAHNGLLGTGRTADWNSHRIEHELSGIYDVPHGAGLAVIFPAWMQYVFHEDVQRFVQFAVRVWDVDLAFGDPERIALEGIARMKDFYHRLGLPVSLAELGVPDDRLEEMAQKATLSGPIGQFKPLTSKDVLAIYQLAR
jgi:alcohol dehydrogenase YqhD (iron-dependent ADH family)